MVNDILKYQELDGQLIQLDREITNSSERNSMNSLVKYLKEAQSKIVSLETLSANLLSEYDLQKKEYEKLLKDVTKLSKTSIEKKEANELNDIVSNINSIASELFNLEKKLNNIAGTIKEVLKDFEITKSNAWRARTKHKETKEKFNKMVGDAEPKKQTLKTEMAKLEKKIPADVFTKYKNVKHDNIFPVFVPVQNKTCSGCRIAIPSGKLDKLKTTQFMQCEQCGRVLYTE